MPRKKVVHKVVDKKDDFIEPKEALEMLGITTEEDVPVIDEPVEKVPEVHVPKIYETIIWFQKGPLATPENIGCARYRELTNELSMGSDHPRFQAVFVDYSKSNILVTKNGTSYVIDNSDKKEWITNLCYANIGYKLKSSEARVYNEVG